MTAGYDIAEVGDKLEVRGVSRSELTEALDLIRDLQVEGVLEVATSLHALQADHVEANRAELLRALMGHQVSLTPPASLTQMQQLAARRNALLTTPIYTHQSLAKARGTTESTARTWLARQRSAHKLFSVKHDRDTLIPAFQLDEHGQPRPELQPILAALHDGGVQGWSVWTWLTEPTSFLSGGIPEQIAYRDPLRVLRAARRFAAAPAA